MSYTITKLSTVCNIEKIIMVHYFEYSPSFVFDGEVHDFWELVYVDSGSIKVNADESTHVLEKGHVIFHQPNEFHTLSSYNKSCPNLVILSFVCSDPIMESFRYKLFRTSTEERELFRKIVAEMREAFSTPIHIPIDDLKLKRRPDALMGCEQLISCYMEQLIIGLYRRHFSPVIPLDLNTDVLFDFAVHESSNPFINAVIEYLTHHLHSHMSIEQICQGTGVGRSRIQELFKAEIGCGVMEYFNKMKAASAKQLLRNSRHSVAEIGDMLGFSSTPYFSSFFKHVVGKSPSQYRRAVMDIRIPSSDTLLAEDINSL